MPAPTADEIVKQSHTRLYMQWGGPRPRNAMRFSGVDAQYAELTGVGSPNLGGIEATYVHDPRFPGRYKLISRTKTPPDLPSATLVMHERKKVLPRAFSNSSCPFNLYVYSSECRDPSDVVGGSEFYTQIYSLAEITDKDLGDRVTRVDDNPIVDTLSLVLSQIYAIGPLAFGEVAQTAVSANVVGVAYGSNPQCGTCGINDDGTDRVYFLQAADGYSNPPKVVYLVGGVVASSAITGIASSATVEYIAVVGDKLIVGSKSAGGYYYATLNKFTGAPQNWTLVTAGFVANQMPNDVYVNGPREIIFAGDLGAIYKSTNIAQGVSVLRAGGAGNPNLLRVRGDSAQMIVAAGASGTVLVSINGGLSFNPTPNVVDGAVNVTALEVMGNDYIWVGLADGRLAYSETRGETPWTVVTIAGATAIHDIVFANQEIGYVAYNAGIDGRIVTTWNGGADFAYSTDASQTRLVGLPVNSRPYRLAVPTLAGDAFITANNLAVAGLGGNGVDGFAALGIAGYL